MTPHRPHAGREFAGRAAAHRARALVVRPAFLVGDEPTARLEEDLSAHVLATPREVCAQNGTGVLMASHDPIVMAHADRVVRLSDGLVVA
jgi:putative ABC transport system ATP-binding protein